MNRHKYLFKKINHIPLRTQLLFLIITTFSIVIVSIIVYIYHSNSNTIMDQQISRIETLLELETQNLDGYFTEIDRYSLLLRHEPSFMQTISTKKPLTYVNQTSLQALLRSSFDSRNDLISYRLYLVNHSTNFKIDSTRHKVLSFYNESVADLPNYEAFTKGKYYKSIEASEDSNIFMIYYRTIINVEDQTPLAIVEITIDTSYIESLSQKYHESNEVFCIVDDQDRLLYTNSEALINKKTIKEPLAYFNNSSTNNYDHEINDVNYLIVSHTSEDHGYKLFNFKPIFDIDQQLAYTRDISFILGFISISVMTILATVFISLVTKPLRSLAHRLRAVGSGNFTTTADIGGSLEIANLSEDFNAMIFQINELIKKNYLSELNEKTSRLIALEAQLNPHFLYNILQAISAEAVVNGQPQINFMVTALASMLRYSIKGGDFSTVANEIKHVRDYFLLQQSRFEEHLTYEMSITSETEKLIIPKISIQTLVENSIIHGMTGDTTSIHIQIHCYIKEDYLIITVADNGNGITQTGLMELNKAFENYTTPTNSSNNIGLLNIYSRLQLLYNNQATLNIESEQNKHTKVTLTIPIRKEI